MFLRLIVTLFFDWLKAACTDFFLRAAWKVCMLPTI